MGLIRYWRCFRNTGRASPRRPALRSLVDPASQPLSSPPAGEQDLLIAASHSWVVALDNLSGIQSRLSDALCRLSTGGGFSRRHLYSDAGQTTLNAMRPIFLTSIDNVSTRADLLDRTVTVRLRPVVAQQRWTESEYWARFRPAQPRILGALLDGVAAAQRNSKAVRPAELGRMADFECWVAAAELALGWAANTFSKSYCANRNESTASVLEATPVAAALQTLLGNRGTWTGTATDLFTRLARVAGKAATPAHGWPRNAQILSVQLTRLQPNLRQVGIEIVRERGSQSLRPRRLTITQTGHRSLRTPARPTRPSSAPDARDGPLTISPCSTDCGVDRQRWPC